MSTFAELGIPFPLHEAPVSVENDSDFCGSGTCTICGASETPTFRLGIGTALIIPCPSCNTNNGLDVDDRAEIICRKCETTIPFPKAVAETNEPMVCYTCLRAGRAALTKDTEFGMVSWEQAFSGVTHGIPGLKTEQFNTVPVSEDGQWLGVRLPEEVMWELLRTPKYGTWQGEEWLFCCKAPMTFVGEWSQEQFNKSDSKGNGETLLRKAVPDLPDGTWDAVGQGLSVYMFQCKKCHRMRGHWDCD